MDIATDDFQDWELLQSSSDSDSAPVSCPYFDESFNETGSGGFIQVNYFSLDAHNRPGEDLDDGQSARSDNPSWIDPESEENPNRYLNKESGEFWSDSGSEDRKFVELEKNEEIIKRIEGIFEEKEGKSEGLGNLNAEPEVLDVGENENKNIDESNPNWYMNNESGEFWSDSGSMDRKFVELEKNEEIIEGIGGIFEEKEGKSEGLGNLNAEPEVLGEEENENKNIDESGAQDIDDDGSKKTGELNKRSVVWWKMPVEFFRYCVCRMSPVWAVSVAAAVMGFAILGRRLYKMKKKTRGLGIKVAVDDKKVSQVMSRVARLNEAFLIVKRVPVIRPSLPAVGSTNTWPVMSLR
ncbi:hypothetical protein CASFOL_016536 [Castilleja foliolosa]|uniref:DUF6821 domain-containing protein n=1 Tax=Castilleja foliolosa TaxID=1961234 RepID=A0ABD3D9E3_9LAMI